MLGAFGESLLPLLTCTRETVSRVLGFEAFLSSGRTVMFSVAEALKVRNELLYFYLLRSKTASETSSRYG